MAAKDSCPYHPLQSAPPTSDDVESSGTDYLQGGDVVQFIESVAVVKSDAGHVEVGVMRIGQCKGSCTCTWRTEEISAKAGKHFLASSGSITMKDGEHSAHVSIPILNDSHWDATKEFCILIENPDNCILGLYLKVVRIKILDVNTFPTNEYKGMLPGIAVNEFALFCSFLKFMWQRDGVQSRTCLVVSIGFLHSAYEYLHLTLSMYMIDKVFNLQSDEEELFIPGNRLLTAYVVAVALLLPKVLFFLLAHLENNIHLDGIMRAELTKDLFRKFMNYNSESREAVPISTMSKSLGTAASSVAHGYERAIVMLRVMGHITISMIFTLEKNPGAWWGVVAVSCIMVLWCTVRTRVFIEASENAGSAESKLLATSNMALTKMSVISAYRQRPQMNDIFAGRVDEAISKSRALNTVVLNNKSLPQLMGPALVALYTLIGASLVLNRELGLGTYLATMTAFGNICKNCSVFYEDSMDIISSFPALKKLTVMLNRETELPQILEVSRKRTETTKKKRAAMSEGDVPRADRMGIEVRNVSFWHGRRIDEEFRFEHLNFHTSQGKIIGLNAISGAGRKTLLDLLAGTLYPTNSDGEIFIPSHLRVAMISREICILDHLSIWANLTFGNRTGNDPNRVEALLKHFKMDIVLDDEQFQRDLRQRKAEVSGGSFREEEHEIDLGKSNPILKYSESDQALIHLLRGFIMNPEVMLLHRPFVHFHDDNIANDLKLALVGQRDNRGFKMPSETLKNRRPRTIFMSYDVESEEAITDCVWDLPSEPGGQCESRSSSKRSKIEDRAARPVRRPRNTTLL